MGQRCYIYVVDRDFGFAPNPFHGVCTLATCKPGIRAAAQVGDWVIGMGGTRIGATGRCIFGMRVTDAFSFNEYWSNPDFRDKKPVRNGSSRMLVGDNIYHCDHEAERWRQADSHHSNPDGTLNPHNVEKDTRSDRVLVSSHFFYFGSSAPVVPDTILAAMNYRNGRNYRVFREGQFEDIIVWLETVYGGSRNLVLADPFDFDSSALRYSTHDNRVR